MAAYYIAPYRPDRSIEELEEETTLAFSKTLRIEPEWYKEQLLERWPKIQFYSHIQDSEALFWGSNDLPLTSLMDDLQMVALSDPDTPFFVWHRSIIPSEYRLFVWNEAAGDEDVVELEPGVTEEEFDRKLHHLD